MRSVSDALKRSLYAQDTDDVLVILITIDHPDLEEPIRLCSNSVNVVSRGNVYVAYPFDLALAHDSDKQPPAARLTIDNVDRRIIAALRSLQSTPMITFEIVRAATPDVVEAVYPNMILINASYNALTITGNLSYKSLMKEPWPQHIFTPGWFPGLF